MLVEMIVFCTGFCIGDFLGKIKGEQVGKEIATIASCDFIKYCMPKEYLNFLDTNNIPISDEKRKEFTENSDVYKKHLIINSIKELAKNG